jgi:hypothetical protein
MSDVVKQKNEMFSQFIDKIEVVYAVLLAWGFARVAEKFVYEWSYVCATVISGLVLIRFFFAASHNLKPIAQKSEVSLLQQRILFFLDIPLLIFHSFLYYRMCVVASQLNFVQFYRVFCYLLGINILWLISINYRLGKEGGEPLKWCSKWTLNNLVHISILSLFLIFGMYYLLFWVALSNCVIDFVLTAPDYLGFRRKHNPDTF